MSSYEALKSSSVLAYFELHQVLNVGFSLRFLPILDAGIFGEAYQLSSKEMIVWANQNDQTCTSFKSLKFEVQQDGTLKETGRLRGRIFPCSLRVLEDDVQGFKLHVDRASRCTEERKITDIIKTVFTSGDDSVYVMPSSNSVVLDAKLLETEEGIFIIIAYEMRENGERMHVYEYDGINDNLDKLQKIHSHMSLLDVTNIRYDSKIQFVFKSSISKVVSTSAFWSNTDKDIYLFLAKEKTKVFKNNVWSFVYSEPVEVYVLEDDLKFCYEINIYGILSFDTFRLDGETYILALSPHLQTVYLLQYRGYAGFQVIQEFSAPGVVSVSVFSPGHDIFLAIASKTGQTRILKCVMRGRNFVESREIKELNF
ncbi:hypothetical protein HNY73_013197 [Argiope bruennichi]|uniref:Uncharacterized protein n=1 Tax=Argiope bruennichi TaxID=94029 RepID=A0A8T0EZ62_ARGBR|nr:hypothetical protein HNY73_013197 [Argiope bruennichi]